jgi:hypothetical protein
MSIRLDDQRLRSKDKVKLRQLLGQLKGLWDNPAAVMEAVKQTWRALLYASDRLKDDFTIVMEAVQHDGWALKYASERLQDDFTIVMEAVKQTGTALEYASVRLQDDAIIVMEAVKQTWRALEYASERLQDDAIIVMEAVKQKGWALEYASVRLQDDAIIVMEAGTALNFASDRLKDDVTFVMKVFKYDKAVLFHASKRARKQLTDIFAMVEAVQKHQDPIDTPLLDQDSKHVARECERYYYECIWLLGQVCGPLPTNVIHQIDEFANQSLSQNFVLIAVLHRLGPDFGALRNIYNNIQQYSPRMRNIVLGGFLQGSTIRGQ